ncbi:MAG: Gfo/Idh/MocA family oxidoreductase [Bacteroidetes bacterium]|nr:Gfo/Idh/MocA family oxidoreductase [Bacteroidota bacterium]
MIKVGIVGYGLSGRYLQAPFFQSNPDFELKYIVTSQEIDEKLFPKTKATKTIDDLLMDDDIDLISICSPSYTHFEYGKKCLEAGKHVLLEKPVTATFQETQILFQLANSKGLHLFVYQNRRFDSDFLTVKKVIESRVLGDILSYEAHFDRFKPLLNPKKWKEVVSPANGILYDLGSHLIDQSVCLFGIPSEVSGKVFTQREGSEIDDAFDIYLDYGKTKVTLKSSLMVKNQGPKYTIHGTKGSFVKYGIDVQEEHLVSGKWPISVDFGKESNAFDGSLVSNISGLEFTGKIETLQGRWSQLFENISDVIQKNQPKFFKDEEILIQMQIIENIKRM